MRPLMSHCHNAEQHADWANRFHESGQWEKPPAELKHAVALNPDQAIAMHHLVETHLNLSQMLRARYGSSVWCRGVAALPNSVRCAVVWPSPD
jgi:hypothetical protein